MIAAGRIAYLDFEFNGISEHTLNLVCVAVRCTERSRFQYQREFWLYGSPAKQKEAARFFKHLIEQGYTFVSYVMEAEARGLMALFRDDDSWMKNFRAIDLYIEYRCLLNHNHKLAYGEQYLKGKVITTTPPPNKFEAKRFSDGKAEEEAHHKPSYSLAAAAFKLLGEKLDTEEKYQVRDIIIEGDPQKIWGNMPRIQRYCLSDIQYLPKMLNAIVKLFMMYLDVPKHAPEEARESLLKWGREAELRGDYAVRTARMLRSGYPVNQEELSKLVANIPQIIEEAIGQVLEVPPHVPAFRRSKKGKYSVHEKPIRDWIKAQDYQGWRRTDGGKKNIPQLSLSKDAFGDFFDSHSEGFGGAFYRYLKTKQSLNGFIPSKTSTKGVFSDFAGADGRVRPYYGIYGSQASRSQPGSVGFIPLKAHWMRVFIEPKPGWALAQGDFASQEFLIAAILSQDEEMIHAYKSGDVYLAFGKAAGLIPPDGTKDTHKKQRDMCKTMVLGVSYDLSAKGLAPRLSAVTGEKWTEDRAQDLIDKFYETYSDYADWKNGVKNEYRTSGFSQLSDGWVMWGDNDNERSVGNFPVQGEGAVIMRQAVRDAQDAGLNVLYTVHDSLTIEFPSNQPHKARELAEVMAKAFEKVMSQFGITAPVRIDCEAWSVDYAATLPTVPGVKFCSEHVSAKGAQDLEKYRKYLLATI